MDIPRIVPDLSSPNMEASKKFYADFVGLTVKMDMGWVATLVSPSNPTAQITLVSPDDSGIPQPRVSIEVEDVASLYEKAKHEGVEIVYPLTDEPWGVRRFFVKDPSGHIINLLSHTPQAPD